MDTEKEAVMKNLKPPTNAFNYLFGTATESEIKHLEKNVNLLNQKDLAIAHQFNGTLQVINSTRVAASKNRLAFKSMTKVINSLNIAYAKTVNSIRGDTVDILSINPRPAGAPGFPRPAWGGVFEHPPPLLTRLLGLVATRDRRRLKERQK